MKKHKARYVQCVWNISGAELPVKVYYEWRNSRRVSIGKNTIIVRLPWASKTLLIKEHEDWAKKWLHNLYAKNPAAFDHFTSTQYSDGDSIYTTKKIYSLSISKEQRKTGSAKNIGDEILLNIPNHLSKKAESQILHTLIGRILAQDNKTWVEKRIYWLNQHYINEPITSVKLKNNRSNWGSCSSGGNINISVRLLFAPEEVQDYVLIHELAHLKELNHTSRFWNIVEKIMPDYKKKERWLKENSHLCNF